MITCAKCGSTRRESLPRDAIGWAGEMIATDIATRRPIMEVHVRPDRCADCKAVEIVPNVDLDERPMSPVPEGARCVSCGTRLHEHARLLAIEQAARAYVVTSLWNQGPWQSAEVFRAWSVLLGALDVRSSAIHTPPEETEHEKP